MAAKPKDKKSASKSPAANKTSKSAKPAAKAPVKKAAPTKALSAKEKTKVTPPAKPKKVDAKRSKAEAALEAALAEVTGKTSSSSTEGSDDEFDPAAFFAANGGKGLIRAHVMRKERVDFNLGVRYRFLKGPLVFNADLLNLSKGGLCLRTPEVVKSKTVIRIEIPLPHTSELFAVQAEVIWSDYIGEGKSKTRPIQTGLRFLPMSLAKQAVINQFIQQRRDEVIMAKIGLDKFTDSVPVAGLD